MGELGLSLRRLEGIGVEEVRDAFLGSGWGVHPKQFSGRENGGEAFGDEVRGGVAWCTRENSSVGVGPEYLEDGLDDCDGLASARSMKE